MYTFFSAILNLWANAPLEYWDDFNLTIQLMVHGGWVLAITTFAGEESLPPIEMMANELERGIWAKWLQAYLGGLAQQNPTRRTYHGEPVQMPPFKPLGGAVEERLAGRGPVAEGTGSYTPDRFHARIIRSSGRCS